MPQTFSIKAIGRVSCARTAPDDDNWDAFPATIQLDQASFGPDALRGLESFSHVDMLYILDRVRDAEIVTSARHPRGRGDWPQAGIFAQRGKARPNRIGVTICRFVSVKGTELNVVGLDAIDGTPVIDIKPVMSGFQPRGAFKKPGWAEEIMRTYWAPD